MAFRLADVKKTVRSRSDGERYVHPRLLDVATTSARVTLALNYFQSRLGRVRREVDSEMLVRFFGDATMARGLVACLGASYRWRTQEFADVLEPGAVTALAAKAIYSSSDLRLFLYDHLNAHGDGFLPATREAHLQPLAQRLTLAPAKLDQLVALDAEENAVLVRVGPVPEPEQVVALYNYQTVDALLRNSIYLEAQAAVDDVRASLEDSCALHGVRLSWEGKTARLHNEADAFGSYARHGLRLTRALYSAAAQAPDLLASGRAQVQMPGKKPFYLLDQETRRALTNRTGRVRRGEPWPGLRDEWNRRRAAAGTAGWRLVTAPEPALSPAGLVVASYACRQADTQVFLWPISSSAGLDDLLALRTAGISVLAVVTPGATVTIPETIMAVRGDGGVAGIVGALNTHWDTGRAGAVAQALEGLLLDIANHGFLPETQVMETLGCATVDELSQRLRHLDEAQAVYLPGLGLCSPVFAEGMRQGLRRRRRRTPAA